MGPVRLRYPIRVVTTMLVAATLTLLAQTFLNGEARAEDTAGAASPKTDLTADDFTRDVAPILEAHCVSCHGPDVQEHQLRLDTFDGINTGGKAGRLIVPKQPDESLLIAAVRYRDESLQMPPDKKLSEAEIRILENWVASGAPHPGGTMSGPESQAAFDVQKAREFWSFQIPTRPAVPQVKSPDKVLNPIDAFILKELDQKGLPVNDVADRRTLIRRASFDLTGLPPAPEDVERFVNDTSPNAFAYLIDRLLDSSHYGEYWARHWLDVVRYADSNGLDENIAHGHGWKYRDYVIASLNKDKPWNEFIREQVAGDILAAQLTGDSTEAESRRIEMTTGTGFLALGPKVLAEADQMKMLMDIIDEQIDTTGKVFLGMTFGCARCHNHKFDPVAQSDYYAMVGIFKSTLTMESLKTVARWHENDVSTASDRQRIKDHQASVEKLKGSIAQLVETSTVSLGGGARTEDQFPAETRERLTKMRDELKQLEASVPVMPTAMGVREGTPEQARINIRGSHLMLGPPVRRNVPVVLEINEPLSISDQESGRLQLADWLASPRNPLTARVLVNRVWRWHFGRGIVASTDNFGHLGEQPSNQPLLDWLATEFVEQGWSLKQLHRTMMLSRTWQLSSRQNPIAAAVDPGNVMLWRANERRLEAESIRDATLAVSGLLDRTMGGSLLHVGNREFLFNHTSKDETKYDALRRSVYLPVIRNNLYDGFSLFDCPDCAVPNGDRATSTVASQALYFLNSDMVLKASEAFAKTLLAEIPAGAPNGDELRIQQMFRRTFGRMATSEEVTDLMNAVTSLTQELAAANSTPAATAATTTASTASSPDSGGTETKAVAAAGEASTSQKNLTVEVWTAIAQSILASNEFVYVK
ncbi:MAG: PSD1 and planctomycete cytochrome C domain-containing protein [Planctomyces sp.]